MNAAGNREPARGNVAPLETRAPDSAQRLGAAPTEAARDLSACRASQLSNRKG